MSKKNYDNNAKAFEFVCQIWLINVFCLTLLRQCQPFSRVFPSKGGFTLLTGWLGLARNPLKALMTMQEQEMKEMLMTSLEEWCSCIQPAGLLCYGWIRKPGDPVIFFKLLCEEVNLAVSWTLETILLVVDSDKRVMSKSNVFTNPRLFI